MDLPQPPDEPELKNIIDKLANFVARNGPDFENMTKQKQKDNPRFSFLFGGEHFNYYQCKVTTEQAIMNQQKQKLAQQQAIVQQAIQTQTSQLQQQVPGVGLPWPGQGPPPVIPGTGPRPPVSSTPPPSVIAMGPGPNAPVALPGNIPLPNITQLQDQIRQQEAQLGAQKAAVELQVKQSEQNLSAQYQSLKQQQQVQIDDAIIKAEEEEIKNAALELDIDLDEFASVVQPIIESCTKDAISNGKNWIFNHNLSPKHGLVISRFLGKMITSKESSFESRLHLIYLINDVLHHCSRKNADDLKKALETVVTPVFCSAHSSTADEDKKQKLVKLLNLWCNNKYFDEMLMEKLKDPTLALSDYQAGLISKHAPLVTKISQDIQSRYQSLQKQHQDYAYHLTNQLTTQQQQLEQFKQQLQQAQAAAAVTVPPPQTSSAPPGIPTSAPPTAGGPPGFPAPPQGFGPPPGFSGPPPGPPGPTQQFDYGHGQVRPLVQDYNHGQGGGPPPPRLPILPLPDLSKPPPGFPAIPPGPPPSMPPPTVPLNDMDLMPTVPYFDLPAGLMAPLVKLEDFDYKSLVPKDIRLPPPMPPSERLLAAVEAFYSAPSHDLPRDADGWEKLGLFEFLKAKEKAKRIKQAERRKSRSRSRSKSRSPVRRRRYNSRSRSRSPPRQPTPRIRRRRSRSRTRSRSPSRSSSSSRSPSPRRRRPRSRSRSVTPPSMMPMFQPNVESQLGEDNKGFSLLKKMGWGGGGLGSSEQGIVEPIKAGDARDKMDMFKGIGISTDPFEQFRKNKSQGFIQRMRSRDEATGTKRGNRGERGEKGDRGDRGDRERDRDRDRDRDDDRRDHDRRDKDH